VGLVLTLRVGNPLPGLDCKASKSTASEKLCSKGLTWKSIARAHCKASSVLVSSDACAEHQVESGHPFSVQSPQGKDRVQSNPGPC
jgi:hypothetical protein